jgi:hypothetical protein
MLLILVGTGSLLYLFARKGRLSARETIPEQA